jgi:hypothetical protein
VLGSHAEGMAVTRTEGICFYSHGVQEDLPVLNFKKPSEAATRFLGNKAFDPFLRKLKIPPTAGATLRLFIPLYSELTLHEQPRPYMVG